MENSSSNYNYIRKATLVLSLSMLLTFLSCGPGETYPHQQHVEMKLPPIHIPVLTAKLESASGSPACPEYGEGCFIPLPPIHLPSYYYTRYAELKLSSENNTLDTYLTNNADWQTVLPYLSIQSREYNKLVDGSYKLNFFSDSAIAIYDPSISRDNLIKLYKPFR